MPVIEPVDYVGELRRISREIMKPAPGTRPRAYDGLLIKEAATLLEMSLKILQPTVKRETD